MRFSQHFGVTRTKKDDWFDPHLTVDTRLFIDPLLILRKGTTGQWRGAHDELIAHFVACYELIAADGRRDSPNTRRAGRLLTFPEPAEFCLGYTSRGTRGSGGGQGVANQMANAIAVAIGAGLSNPEHIEELGILNEGIGADRIGDAVCNILKARFVRYTQAVCTRHGVPVEEHRLRNARCYSADGRWIPETVLLPTNPDNGKPILLTPARFLNDLPTLNADDWFDSNINLDVRDQMNLSVGQKVRKADIVKWAREHPDRVRQWAREVADQATLDSYDFSDDPLGVVFWDRDSAAFAASNPIQTVQGIETTDDLRDLLTEMLSLFRRFVELQGGWRLLWTTEKKPKPEEAAQLLFLGMAQAYFRLFGVELDREVDLGRGPVDFKLSKGTEVRMLLEFKKAENGKFWNGLDHQLPSYLASDDCPEGWFVALRYSETRAAAKKFNELPERVRRTAIDTDRSIQFFAIDARRKASASTISGPRS